MSIRWDGDRPTNRQLLYRGRFCGCGHNAEEVLSSSFVNLDRLEADRRTAMGVCVVIRWQAACNRW